ncbi:diacylglycerol kinase 3-like [Iris pallida]|uniref:Diacylglycerol kinase n=1 Tax=Iris pallida TaxID=29817 RepID=A0AAX6DK70_IRIPA|nr:diacylglycerol kinase 3-like [Iris pallida]
MEGDGSGGASGGMVVRSSVVDSLKGLGLASGGLRVDKEYLKRRITMPKYLRTAVAEAIRTRTPAAAAKEALRCSGMATGEEQDVPHAPVVVFVNSKSGGRNGEDLKRRLQELMGPEQVIDLSIVKPHEFVNYGLGCLEKLAELGDKCARGTRDKLRIMVAGGDGTVGWVLGSLGELFDQREPVPPTAVIPLGTGNDLSRSFGWGGSFPFAWRSAVKRSLQKAIIGPICRLDSWHVTVFTPAGETVELPHSLTDLGECTLSEDVVIEGEMPEKITGFEGVFYNYFSIGMDAKVAYGFHHLRNTKPFLARGPVSNKLIYSGYSCTQGWFCTPCMGSPSLRVLKNILRIHIKKVNCSEWEQISVPPNVRSIVALNLHNYGSGRNPWGQPKPKYLEKRGFVEAHADDGLLEIFGLKQGWHATFVMVELINAKHIAQAAAIRFEIRGGQCKRAYMQMDGEPWKQGISNQSSTLVEITRVPHQSLMISGE